MANVFATARRRLFRNVRLMVPLCIALICGSFAASALLQIKLERQHALGAAAGFAQTRAADLAGVTAAALERMAWAAKRFAADPGAGMDDPAIRNVAVFGAGGALIAASSPHGPLPVPPRAALRAARTVFAQDGLAGIAFADGTRIVAALFDARALAPGSLHDHAALLLPGNRPLAQAADWQGATARVAVPGWPLTAVVGPGDGAPQPWIGMLPLYVFAILGPAVAGGWLAALFVGTFERHAKAAQAVRALRSVRPVEARLMVRLANAERGAVEAARSKAEFIAHMSHELRTPLNAVIGFSEVIADGLYGAPGHPKYSEYARDIAESGRLLHAKIGDILEFANIEAGHHPLKLERVALAALVRASMAEHANRAFSRRIALELGMGAPGDVRADPGAVKRILSNLIANALRYTGEGGRVRLDVRMEEGAGIATIADSGMGFSGAERGRAGHAFARFDRAGAVTGAGLGLAIAMELARRMGGAMTLASTPGEGSVMELRLPLAGDPL